MIGLEAFLAIWLHIWLVVDLPLWKLMEFVSWDDEIPNIWKNKTCSKPPTRVDTGSVVAVPWLRPNKKGRGDHIFGLHFQLWTPDTSGKPSLFHDSCATGCWNDGICWQYADSYTSAKTTQKNCHIKSGWWFEPEKYESQLGWWNSQYMESPKNGSKPPTRNCFSMVKSTVLRSAQPDQFQGSPSLANFASKFGRTEAHPPKPWIHGPWGNEITY